MSAAMSAVVRNAKGRLRAVELDGLRSLGNLREIVKIGGERGVNPEIRVAINNSIIVSAVSTVEETFRQLFSEYLLVLQEEIPRYRNLRKQLQRSNEKKSVEELRSCLNVNDYAAAEKLINDLSNSLKNEQGYALAIKSIVHNDGNFKTKQLTDIAKRMGVEEIWKKISRSEKIGDALRVDSAGERHSRLLVRWNEIYDERDAVVHRISEASGWAAEKVVDSIRILELVIERLSACLTLDLKNILDP